MLEGSLGVINCNLPVLQPIVSKLFGSSATKARNTRAHNTWSHRTWNQSYVSDPMKVTTKYNVVYPKSHYDDAMPLQVMQAGYHNIGGRGEWASRGRGYRDGWRKLTLNLRQRGPYSTKLDGIQYAARYRHFAPLQSSCSSKLSCYCHESCGVWANRRPVVRCRPLGDACIRTECVNSVNKMRARQLPSSPQLREIILGRDFSSDPMVGSAS
jgi:hypothetical protein